ncbi:MAG: HipA domain-containing protein [Deltaproteobacteria bacterium]|nr:HipA domain-containing protein [Deltaproteobacteria bacterium]
MIDATILKNLSDQDNLSPCLPGLLADSLPDRYGNALINAWLATQGRTSESFMTRRFDRTETGGKLHMQSLGALMHFDFNFAGFYGYEQALQSVRRLGLKMDAVEQLFRRMVFNIVARNQDDHVKNIAFLMGKAGQWTLAPAFDVIYAFQPTGLWTSRHQMTLGGKREDFSLDDFKSCARGVSLKRGRAEAILAEVQTVVSRWRDYADETGVAPEHRDAIQNALRLRVFT